MFSFIRRHGMTYRLYDKPTGRIAVISFGSDYICDGSHRPFAISIFTRAWYTTCTGERMCGVNGGKRYEIRIARLGYRYHRWPTPLGRWIGRRVYRSWSRLLRTLARAPRAA